MVGCTLDFQIANDLSRLPTPVVESISPAIVADAASVTFKLSGKNFSGISELSIASRVCNLQVISDTLLECTVNVDAQSDIADISYKLRNEGHITAMSTADLPTARRALVLGQESVYTISKGMSKGMNTPSVVTKIKNKFYYAIRSNCKILIMNSAPTASYPGFDGILGQDTTDIQECAFGRLKRRQTFGLIMDLHSDDQRMVVADADNNRVLIWKEIPTSPMQGADVVLGQADFETNEANFSGVSARSLSAPQSARIFAGKLIVADRGNNRVLIWNSIPTSNNTPADVVIGQVDGVANSANQGAGTPTASSLSAPEFADVIDGNLVISDTANHRVLIYEGIPASSNTAAKYVLGQTDFVTVANAAGSATNRTFAKPQGFAFDGQKFYVVDNGNNRVLVWNSVPAQDYAIADMVLGQPSFTGTGSGVTQKRFYAPKRVSAYDGLLYVADTTNHRVMVFDIATLASNADALYVIGQPDFVSRLPRNPDADIGMINPTSAFSDGQKLAAVDYGKNRVLLWNNMPSESNAPPDLVLGQASLAATATASGADGLRTPFDALIVGQKLIVSDMGNHRVLIWNSWPTVNKQAADVVIGQANFTAVSANRGSGTPTEKSMSGPRGLFSNGQNLIVTDYGNHRILIFNTIPTLNDTAADVVVGQADFSGKLPGRSAMALTYPQRAKVIDNKLIVVDRGNKRLLIYDSVPIANGAAATHILGQMDMTSMANHRGVFENPSIFESVDFVLDNGKFKILTSEDRILSYTGIPLSPLTIPTIDFGTAPLMTYNPLGILGVQGGFGFQIVNGMYIIADYANNRILLVK